MKGYKNKKFAGATALTVATGLIAASIGLGTLHHSKQQNTPHHPSKDSFTTGAFIDSNINTPFDEPDIITNPSETENTSGFEGFVPEPDINTGEDIIGGANLDQNMLKVLDLLTNATRDYFESITGKTTSLEHSSVEYIKIGTDGIITIYGKGKSGNSIKRIISTIKNHNNTLGIYHLDKYTSSPEEFSYEFAKSLKEVLNSPQTTYAATAEAYKTVSNENTTREILQSHLTSLKASNGNNDEIKYLTELLDSSNKINAMIINPLSVETDKGSHENSFTILISTEDYGFTATSSFETPYQPLSIYPSIENHLATNTSSITIESIPQSPSNKMLNQINNAELNTESTLTK